MIRLFFISTILFFISLQIEAQGQNDAQRQGPPERRVMIVRGGAAGEQVQVERIAYFSEQIGLTTDEAQLFWPIYNEMDNRRTALFEERAAIMQKFMNESAKMTDKQLDEHLNRLLAIQKQELALPGEYDAKFRKVLPARKVMNLYVAEMGFRNYLLQRTRNLPPPSRSERIER